MLDQQKGHFVVECDDCGQVLDTQTSNFEAARNLMKREGWRAVKSGSDWQHFCEQCSHHV